MNSAKGDACSPNLSKSPEGFCHGLFTDEMIVAGAVNGNVSACVGQKVNSTTIIVAAFIDELSIGVDIVMHSIMSAIL